MAKARLRKLLDSEFGWGKQTRAIRDAAKAKFGEDITLVDARQILSCYEEEGEVKGASAEVIVLWFIGRWPNG